MLAAHDLLYSSLASDPDLAELVAQFVAELPDRVAALQSSFDSGDLDLLGRTAHQLKGAAGSYGFPQLTKLAATLEHAVRSGQAQSAIKPCLLEDLVDACGRCRAGAP